MLIILILGWTGQTEGIIKGELKLPHPVIEKVFFQEKDYYRIKVEGLSHTASPGSPMLPVKSATFVVPTDAEIDSVLISPVVIETIALAGPVYPVQPAIPFILDSRGGDQVVPPDTLIYQSKSLWPYGWGGNRKVGLLGGYRLVMIEVHPCRYLPSQNKIIFASRIEIDIYYRHSGLPVMVPSALIRQINKNRVKEIVLNPEKVDLWQPVIKEPKGSPFLPPGKFSYIIISGNEAFNEEFKRLQDWKTKKGVPAKIVNIDFVKENYPGRDDAEKLRNFIKDAYSNWGSVWFLLGGQGDYEWEECFIPRRDVHYIHLYMPLYYPDQETIPSDMYYACLDGDWDFDGDGVFGEKEDSVDLFADVYVGRAPCKSVADVETFVNKVLQYEKSPPAGYIQNILLPASLLFPGYNWWGDTVNNAIADIVPAGWNKCKLYESYGNLTRSAVIESLNSGMHFVHYALHGGPGSVGGADGTVYLCLPDIDTLRNGYKLSIQTAISCFTGALDEVWWDDHDCFAEHFLTNQLNGGVASIMNSRFGWGSGVEMYYSEDIDTTFYHKVFTEKFQNIGEALAVTKDAYVPRVTWDSLWVWCLYELNLFGDPEMPLWTASPQNFTVSYPATLPMGTNSFVVTVSNGFSPVEGARVCCMMDTIVYAVETTDVTGDANFNNIELPYTGVMHVTVTKENYLPYEGDIDIDGSGGIFLVRYVVTDTAGSSDGNGEINSGETIDLNVWVRNTGTLFETSLRGSLYTDDTYISILRDTTTFPDITPGDSAQSFTAFRIHIADFTPEEYFAPCTLLCWNSGNQWISPFMIHIIGQEVISIEPDKIVFDYTAKTKASSTIDTLLYDDGNPVQNVPFSSYPYMGVRFVPDPACTLLQALVAREPIITNYNDKLYVMTDNGGLPGTVIDSLFYAPQHYSDSGFTKIPLYNPYNPFVFQEPFWLCVSDQNTSNGSLLGDATGTGHSYVSTDGVSWTEYNTDFLIRVVVARFTPINLTDSACFWLKNPGTATLTIKEMALKNNSSWFYLVDPKFLAIPPQESARVVVRIDTIGLSHDRNYSDTLLIYSNAVYQQKTYEFLLKLPINIWYIPPETLPDIELAGDTVIDTVGLANGNGIIDPGETVDVLMKLINTGDTASYQTTGKLLVYDSYVVVNDSLSIYGTIFPGDTVAGDAYRLAVSSSAPVGHVVPCSLCVTDAAADTWLIPISFNIGSGGIISVSVDSIVFEYGIKKKSNIEVKTLIDTILYDNGPLWDENTYPLYGVRFTPDSTCSVKAAIISIDNVLGYSGDTVILADDNGGYPGTVIEKVSFTAGVGSNIWNHIPFSSGYIDSNDFWILCHIPQTYQSMNDDQGGGTGTGRSFYSLDGASWTQQLSYDYCIRAEVGYFNQSQLVDNEDTSWFYIKNTGDASFTVDTMYMKNNSAWVVWISNSSGMEILPGDSEMVEIVIDTTGLGSTRHEDTLLILSNASGEEKLLETEIPVIIKYVPTGILLSSFSAVTLNGGILLRWNSLDELSPRCFRIRRESMCGTEKMLNSSGIKCTGNGYYFFVDRDVEPNKYYNYWIGVGSGSRVQWYGPVKAFSQNIPGDMYFCCKNNLLSGKNLVFEYYILEPVKVSIGIYDISGRFVRMLKSGKERVGLHRVIWDGKDLTGSDAPSGVYLAVLATPEYKRTVKFMVIK